MPIGPPFPGGRVEDASRHASPLTDAENEEVNAQGVNARGRFAAATGFVVHHAASSPAR